MCGLFGYQPYFPINLTSLPHISAIVRLLVYLTCSFTTSLYQTLSMRLFIYSCMDSSTPNTAGGEMHLVLFLQYSHSAGLCTYHYSLVD